MNKKPPYAKWIVWTIIGIAALIAVIVYAATR